MLAADLLRTKDVRATHKLVADQIAAVRAMPGMDKATCVLALESNLAYAAPSPLRADGVLAERRRLVCARTQV